MANTRGNSPYSTYKTDRIQFIGNPEQRTGTSNGVFDRDQQFVNFYPTLTDSPINGAKKYRLEQRAGLNYVRSTVAGLGDGRGIYYYNGDIYSVVGNTLYRNSTAIQAVSAPIADRSIAVGFVEYASITNKYLIVLDGTAGWTINATTLAVVKITDVDFPSPHSVAAAYLDGYLFVAKSGTADIYNCVLNDPFTWNAGDFLSAEMYPDSLVALCRQNNYIVGIGQKSIEYFYDSGVSPGTPLARNTAAAHTIGTPAPATVVTSEEQVIFVGQTGVGGYTIWIMDGFTPTEIGIDAVKKSLNVEASLILNANAYCIRSGGHRYYVINLSVAASNDTVSTWVYDFDTKMWHQWANISLFGSYNGPFNGRYASDYVTGSPIMLDYRNGFIYSFLYGTSIDCGTTPTSTVPILSEARSAKLDFGNMNTKFMHRFSLVCDTPVRVPGTPIVATFTLSWSDNDYQTWTTPRTITISDTMPTTTQLGSFRRRAFKITYAGAFPLLLEGFEVDTNMGSQ